MRVQVLAAPQMRSDEGGSRGTINSYMKDTGPKFLNEMADYLTCKGLVILGPLGPKGERIAGWRGQRIAGWLGLGFVGRTLLTVSGDSKSFHP